jgi:putative transposase
MMANPRRKFTDDQKLGILEQAGKMGVTAVLHQHHLSYSVFARWKKKFMKSDHTVHDASGSRARSEIKQLLEENVRLKKIIADQALEIAWKEEEIKKYNPTYGKR